jgi:F420-0:gamma-glutamyl ligase-like protein
MLSSMLKTLAATHRSTATKIAAKHKAKIMTPYGLERASKPSSTARRPAGR